MVLDIIIQKSPTIEYVNNKNFTSWFYEKQRSVTFLNPVNYVLLGEHPQLIHRIDHFFFDGLLAQRWLGWLRGLRFCRLSFDFTSVADQFFRYSQDHNKRIYVLGGTHDELLNFTHLIKKHYPSLNFVGQHHGFFNENQFQSIMKKISALDPDVVICGLGCPKQEKVASHITQKLKKTSAITCGGFIHQTQFQLRYYPKWINALGLRTLYRLVKEPHTRKRLKYIPFFLIKTLLENTCIKK